MSNLCAKFNDVSGSYNTTADVSVLCTANSSLSAVVSCFGIVHL